MIVVSVPGVPINEWYGSHGGLISEDNPNYPPTDETVVTVYKEVFQEKYGVSFTGGWGIPIRDLLRQGFKPYSFPKSRLRVVAGSSPKTVSIDRILPSPYHVNEYGSIEDMRMVAKIERRGEVFGKLLARPHIDCQYFTLMNGHKRIWAASVARFETVDIHVVPMSPLEAARQFALFHLGDPEKHDSAYTGSQRLEAASRINDEIDQFHAVFEHVDNVDPHELHNRLP